MKLELLVYNPKKSHVSQDTVDEFENAILKFNVKKRTIQQYIFFSGKIASKLLVDFKIKFVHHYIKKGNSNKFCVLMGNQYPKALLSFMFNKSNNIYLFDAWPNKHESIEKFIQVCNIKNVFVSSKQVAEIFRNKNLNTKFYWIPEGIDMDSYTFQEFCKKDIDVLSFGRKYDLLHDNIVEDLRKKGKKYLYEKKKGDLVFKSRETFIEALSRTKICICIPSNITHPERAGNISTMTIRYLQSMASKCLIFGCMPDEMKELFDYVPIVEIDFKNPLNQLLKILENFDEYIPLIEKNYKYINVNHSWVKRWEAISKII